MVLGVVGFIVLGVVGFIVLGVVGFIVFFGVGVPALVRAMEAISNKMIAKDFIFSLVLISIEMKIVIKLHCIQNVNFGITRLDQ